MTNIFTPRKTPIEAGQTRIYYGGAGYKHKCYIEAVEGKVAHIKLEGRPFTMPTFTIGEEIK